MVAAIGLSPHQMSARWVDLFWKMRSVCIQRMLSRSGCGLIRSRMRTPLSFTKIGLILLLKAQDYKIKPLWCASRQDFNWTLSEALASSLSGSMQHTMSHNMKITYYLRSSQGTDRDMVSNTLGTRFRCDVLTFLIRHSGCLDAYIKQDNRKYCLFCQMGQGRQP